MSTQSNVNVDLSYGGHGDEGIHDELKPADKRTKVIDIGGNELTDKSCKRLAVKLRDCTALEDLDMRDNRIGQGFGEIVSSLQKLPRIRSLRMDENVLKDYGCTLCSHLLRYCNLTELQLCNNHITTEGAKILSEVLGTSFCNLRVLGLAYNAVLDPGVQEIMAALQRNKQLEEIDLSDNHLGNGSMIAIAQLLDVSTTIRSINIAVNKCTSDGAAVLAQSLRANRSLRKLDIGCNPVGTDGFVDIAKALSANCTLVDLSAPACEIDNSCMAELQRLADTNTSLTKLEISKNSLSEEEEDALVAFVWKNRQHYVGPVPTAGNDKPPPPNSGPAVGWSERLFLIVVLLLIAIWYWYGWYINNRS